MTSTPAAMATAPAEERVARFERELARDRALLAFFNYSTLAVSLAAVATLLVLVIPLGRTSPWLTLMSLYAIATRLGVLVARRALAVPRFVERLDDADPGVAAAARAVLERHRGALARPFAVLAEENDGGAPATLEDFARAARRRDPAAWRRTGLVAIAAWSIATLVMLAILVATGGGPTS